MDNLKNKAVDFLKKYSMDTTDVDIDATVKVFLDEMDKGLADEPSSLKMLPTYISPQAKVPKNKPVIVLDAGGTNFRAATVCFDDRGQAVVDNFRKLPMPGIEREVTSEEFFSTLAGYTGQVLDKADTIGFCFSYPCQIMPDKDGKLLHFSKEIKAKQVEGQLIGQNLNKAIAAASLDDHKHVVILNDTVTTLLAAKAQADEDAFDDYVGFILGTGTNICYSEQNSNITKLPELDPSQKQIINVESGAFAKAPMGKIDKIFDESTINPNQQNFEKMISGAYLGQLCLTALKVAADDGLFSTETAENFKNMAELPTKELNRFMHVPRSDNPITAACAQQEDLRLCWYILERLTDRAARLTAINLSSIVLKTGKGKDPTKPVCIVAEGTTFYKFKSLKSRVECYLREYLQDTRGLYTEIVHIDNSTLLGAAIAGLTN